MSKRARYIVWVCIIFVILFLSSYYPRTIVIKDSSKNGQVVLEVKVPLYLAVFQIDDTWANIELRWGLCWDNGQIAQIRYSAYGAGPKGSLLNTVKNLETYIAVEQSLPKSKIVLLGTQHLGSSYFNVIDFGQGAYHNKTYTKFLKNGYIEVVIRESGCARMTARQSDINFMLNSMEVYEER